MKNVMVRAWEIAKNAVVKFGGMVKEYFAQALIMAWSEVKKGAVVVAEDFGFTVIQQANGRIQFAVDAIDGLRVFMAYNNLAPQAELQYRTGRNNKLNKDVHVYLVESFRTALEFSYGSEVKTLKINQGKITWI